MSDSTLFAFLGELDTAGLAAYTPAPPSPPTGPSPLYLIRNTDDSVLYFWDGAAWQSTAGAGDVIGPAASITGELVLYDGTTGKLIKRATTTGIVKATSGVISAATDGADYLSPSTGLTRIAEATPSATGTLSFASLGSYTHLEIRWSARSDKSGTSAEDMNIRFNADTGSNYDSDLLYNNAATTAASFESIGATSGIVGTLPAATATANRAAGGSIRIYDYRGTTFNKVATADLHFPTGTSSGLVGTRALGVTWRNAAAITSITLLLGSGNFVAGSKFTLYGLP